MFPQKYTWEEYFKTDPLTNEKNNRTWAAFYSDCQKTMKSYCQINDTPWDIFIKYLHLLDNCRSIKKLKTILLYI